MQKIVMSWVNNYMQGIHQASDRSCSLVVWLSLSLCVCVSVCLAITPVTESHAPEQRAVNCWKAFTLPLSWLVDLLLRGVPWRLSCELTHASCGRLMGPHDRGGWGCLDEVCVQTPNPSWDQYPWTHLKSLGELGSQKMTLGYCHCSLAEAISECIASGSV